MSGYSIDEIFQFAIKMEEDGEKFYNRMAEKFKTNARVREVFQDLARQEVEHKNSFESMLKRFQSYSAPENFPEEYFAYIRAFAENAVFNQEKLDGEMQKISDPISALEFAMGRELDAVNYYHELKNLVQDSDKEKIIFIIEEEKRHYLYLNRVKREIQGS